MEGGIHGLLGWVGPLALAPATFRNHRSVNPGSTMTAVGSIATVDRRSVFVGSTLSTDRQGGHGVTPAQCQLPTHAPQQKDAGVESRISAMSLTLRVSAQRISTSQVPRLSLP
jgi:hypothetical protein